MSIKLKLWWICPDCNSKLIDLTALKRSETILFIRFKNMRKLAWKDQVIFSFGNIYTKGDCQSLIMTLQDFLDHPTTSRGVILHFFSLTRAAHFVTSPKGIRVCREPDMVYTEFIPLQVTKISMTLFFLATIAHTVYREREREREISKEGE